MARRRGHPWGSWLWLSRPQRQVDVAPVLASNWGPPRARGNSGDSTNKIILPQILNGGGGGVGIAGGKHSSGSKTVVAGFGVPGAGAGAGGGAVVGSGTANTVVGSNGVIVAGGVANVPTSNLNSEYLNFLYLNEY